LWQGLADGSIDILATDHTPWTREQKLDPELSITRLRPGINNLQFMLPMYFSEGVVKGRISLERFVETTSTKAARIFGLFPQKGVIHEGSYADVVVWDPERTTVIRDADVISLAAHTVYDGWPVTGWPDITIRRGEVVFEAGEVNGRPGSERLLTREPWRSA
jgi:dihydropyrimidinase